MNDYAELKCKITPCSETATDIMAAMLAEAGYESFVPDEEGLTAYVPAGQFSADILKEIEADFPLRDIAIQFSHSVIEGKDWNQEWEKNYFQPIIIDNRCVIHSSFHKDIPQADYDIVIDPKMAFGTGHHATTSLIIAQLLETDLRGKAVIDMGTGTGILAILAAMRGASPVSAIEIDPFAESNARENVRLNGQPQINVILGDASSLASLTPADIFIANINRNIITGDIARYTDRLKSGGVMLLSGFYEQDIPVILETASGHRLQYSSHTVKGDNWTCLKLIKL